MEEILTINVTNFFAHHCELQKITFNFTAYYRKYACIANALPKNSMFQEYIVTLTDEVQIITQTMQF